MKRVLLLSMLLLATKLTSAQTPVWSTDIAPILYNKCASCHHSGGIAPFELVSYSEAYSHSGTIESQVSTGKMPPWPPDPYYSRMAHERLLSPSEIDNIKKWVQAGAPQGNPSLAPPAPIFNNNAELPGAPELSVRIPTYTSTASTGDVYQCFVIPSGLLTDKYITAFEALPGNRGIVHHVLVYADTTGTCAALDAASPGPGYTNFGGVGSNDAILLGGWVPGTSPITLPAGFGMKLPKNADIVLQIHYPEGSAGQQDSTAVNFFFSSSSSVRNVRIDPILNHLNTYCTLSPGSSLFIPANQTKTFTETSTISGLIGNISILGIAPHMHLIGKNISVFGVGTNGDTQKYMRINDWDFHWQGFYLFRNIRKMPAGTTLYSTAFYDNTSNNPDNPSNPPIDVYAGEATTDEMMLTFFVWTPYQAGDENIIMDTTALTPLSAQSVYYSKNELFTPYPNPANDEVALKLYLLKPCTVSADIISLDGRIVKHLLKNESMTGGYSARMYSVNDVASGEYILKLSTTEQTYSQRLSIRH